MGISYYNGSGYPDPTAHYAVRHLEEEEKMLHIEYPTGHMDIRMDKFFPATLDRARKLFRLMAMHSSYEEQKHLLVFLSGKEQRLAEKAETYRKQEMGSTKKSDAYKFESLAKEAETQQHRTKRNMELLCEICKLEVAK